MKTILVISSSWLDQLAQLELKEKLGVKHLLLANTKKIIIDEVIQKMVNDKNLYIVFTKKINVTFYNKFINRAKNKMIYDRIFVDGYNLEKLSLLEEK